MNLLLQLAVDGLFAGGSIALLALGFGLIFSTTRIFHLAHGAVYTVAGYSTFLFMAMLGWNMVPALVAVTTLTTVCGVATYEYLYRPMLARAASHLVILGASLGLLIVITNLVPLFFGFDLHAVQPPDVLSGTIDLGVVSFTVIRLLTLLACLLLFVLTLCFLRFSAYGKQLRAVASNPELTEAVGMDVRRIHVITFALGSALAAPAAMLASLDNGIYPTMGSIPVLMASVAVIVGGLGSVGGAALGGLLIGLAENLGIWKIASDWQTAIAFVILLGFILFRPTGFFGQKLWESEI